ncbi:MAG: hypothetical protein LBD37_05175 [Treponema sp.]|jgi:hypothetical protein|nr:hypothetical protein [Treponema sp.]
MSVPGKMVCVYCGKTVKQSGTQGLFAQGTGWSCANSPNKKQNDEFAQVEMLFWSSEEIAQAERAMRESGGISTQVSGNGGQTRIASKYGDFIYDLNEDSTGVFIKGLNGEFSVVQNPEKLKGFRSWKSKASAFSARFCF